MLIHPTMDMGRLLFYFTLSFFCAFGELVVNVRNKGGEIYKETIEANTTHDTISLDFKLADGTLITQFIDARNELQIYKASILPEEDLGEKEIQHLCFVLRFSKQEFISSDAMSKLRQKNPSAIRHPEEEAQWELFKMDILLNINAFSLVSPHIPAVCSSAPNSTYSRHSDMKLVLQILNKNYSFLESSVTFMPKTWSNESQCSRVNDNVSPCVCRYDICTGWYPCGLKYCRGKDSSNKVVNYRCGIKTCSRCRSFEYFVPQHSSCIWIDEVMNYDPSEIDDSFYKNLDKYA